MPSTLCVLRILWAVVGRHFTTVCNDNIDHGLVVLRFGIFNLLHNVHTLHDVTKDNVLSIQVRGGNRSEKELRTVGSGTSWNSNKT